MISLSDILRTFHLRQRCRLVEVSYHHNHHPSLVSIGGGQALVAVADEGEAVEKLWRSCGCERRKRTIIVEPNIEQDHN